MGHRTTCDHSIQSTIKINLAEAVRFELTDLLQSLVFKTSALNRTLPHFRIQKHTGPYRSGQWIRVRTFVPAAFIILCVYEYPLLLRDMKGSCPSQ
jgi:hypothetical protein